MNEREKTRETRDWSWIAFPGIPLLALVVFMVFEISLFTHAFGEPPEQPEWRRHGKIVRVKATGEKVQVRLIIFYPIKPKEYWIRCVLPEGRTFDYEPQELEPTEKFETENEKRGNRT